MKENIYEVNRSSFRIKLTYYENGMQKTFSQSFSFKKYGGRTNALRAAKFRRDELKVKLNSASFILPNLSQKRYTLDDMFELKEKLIPREKETNIKHRLWLDKYMRVDKFFSDIRASDIQESLNRMVYTCSQDTIDRVLSVWRTLYRTSVICDMDLIDQTIKVQKPKSKYLRKKREVVYKYSTLDEFIERTGEKLVKRKDMGIILLSLKVMRILGTRPGETFALTSEDINIKNRVISINKSMDADGNIRTTKTEGSYREIPYAKRYSSLFEELVKKKGYLFVRENGKLLCSNYVSQRLNRVTNGDFRCYMLRHNLATELIENNIDLKTSQKILGHKSAAQTLSYAEPKEEKMREALEKISRL